MNDLLNVSASPHVRGKDSTSTIMRDVALALVPASIAGVINFGLEALLIILVTIATCVLTEYIYEKCMHKKITTNDLSALVTGLLLALNLPSSVPLWIPIIGGVFAILVVKQLYGGLGQNFMNPALAARCFLLISFAGRMTTFTYDGITGATPLALLKSGEKTASVTSMFLGNISGTIGETSALALLIGAAYLLFRKVISLRIPLTYIASFMAFILIFGGEGFDTTFLLTHLFGGGLILGAFFMATDYVTSPITPMGQVVYGILLGVLTGIFRMFGGSAEGVSYAIIFSNLLVPLI
ncbi:RnfABCDGE type electron transport complex subunit D [Anaerosporobacter sp.]